MCTYVTYEGLFAFTQILFSSAAAVAGIITLVIAIVKLYGGRSDTKNKRKK